MASSSKLKEQVIPGKNQGEEGGSAKGTVGQKGQGDKTPQEGRSPTISGKTPQGEPGGGGQGSKDINQLREDIQKTLKSIDYDLKRLRVAKKAQDTPSEKVQSASGKEEESKGKAQQPTPGGPDKTLEKQAEEGGEMGELSGGPSDSGGEETETAQSTPGEEGASAVGEEPGEEQGYSAKEGTEVGGVAAGSKPGDKLYSEKEEEIGPTGQKGFELRLKADKMQTQGKRETLSTGQEVVEGAETFKQHSPTVAEDPSARLSSEVAEEDAIKKVRIPQEYEGIIKEIYKGNR
jgi:hypothetical protein